MKKKQIGVGILVVAVIAIAVGAGYYQKQSEQKEEVAAGNTQLAPDVGSNISVEAPKDGPYTAAAPTNTGVKTYSGSGFTFTYPSTWTTLYRKDSSVGDLVYILKPGQAKTELAGSLSVYKYRQNAKSWASLEDIKKYEQELDAETARLNPDIKPRTYSIVSSGGVTRLSIDDSLQGNREEIFLKNGVAYDIYYNKPIYSTAEQAEIAKIVASFRFR